MILPLILLAASQVLSDNGKALLKTLNPPGECAKCAPVSSPALKVFISFSVPLPTWKDLSDSLEKTNGCFVMRGISENSFSEFSRKLKELRAFGINAPIQIDPEAFDKYQIDAVPAVVQETPDGYHRLVGNIRLDEALRLFAEQRKTS